MCKHVAAVLYGVGARLDEKPELLFTLRGVNHEELIAADAEKAVAAATSRGKSKRLAAAEIGEVFGIDLDGGSGQSAMEKPADGETPQKAAPTRRRRVARAKRSVPQASETLELPRAEPEPPTTKRLNGKTAARKARLVRIDDGHPVAEKPAKNGAKRRASRTP